MTRKDYIALAEAFKQAFGSIDYMRSDAVEIYTGMRIARDNVMTALAADNPRFDKDTFMMAIHGMVH